MNETKTKKVTFSSSLPRGACATFTHEGQLWFAYPQDKIQALGVVMDRQGGAIRRLHAGLIEWINRHPEDAQWVALLIGSVASVQQLALAKAEAWTKGTRTVNEDSADAPESSATNT